MDSGLGISSLMSKTLKIFFFFDEELEQKISHELSNSLFNFIA